MMKGKWYSSLIKPWVGRVVALVGLLVIFPLFLILILITKAQFGSAFFKQPRAGKNGRIFTIYKFQTMTSEKNQDGRLLPDEKRLTRYGQFLRKCSLDELPQLINVIKGDIGLIGPRPLLVEYLPLYNEEQQHRHDIKPGITGWAQVNGRNAISWDDKFKFDVWYVRNCSFFLDLKIISLTLLKVLKPTGISQQGNATMEKFTGSVE